MPIYNNIKMSSLVIPDQWWEHCPSHRQSFVHHIPSSAHYKMCIAYGKYMIQVSKLNIVCWVLQSRRNCSLELDATGSMWHSRAHETWGIPQARILGLLVLTYVDNCNNFVAIPLLSIPTRLANVLCTVEQGCWSKFLPRE